MIPAEYACDRLRDTRAPTCCVSEGQDVSLVYLTCQLMVGVEALQNATKHSCAGQAWISIDEVDGRLRFEIGDDGRGFDLARTNGGSGLQNIRDRVDALEGTLQIASGVEGTRIEGSIPLAV